MTEGGLSNSNTFTLDGMDETNYYFYEKKICQEKAKVEQFEDKEERKKKMEQLNNIAAYTKTVGNLLKTVDDCAHLISSLKNHSVNTLPIEKDAGDTLIKLTNNVTTLMKETPAVVKKKDIDKQMKDLRNYFAKEEEFYDEVLERVEYYENLCETLEALKSNADEVVKSADVDLEETLEEVSPMLMLTSEGNIRPLITSTNVKDNTNLVLSTTSSNLGALDSNTNNILKSTIVDLEEDMEKISPMIKLTSKGNVNPLIISPDVEDNTNLANPSPSSIEDRQYENLTDESIILITSSVPTSSPLSLNMNK